MFPFSIYRFAPFSWRGAREGVNVQSPASLRLLCQRTRPSLNIYIRYAAAMYVWKLSNLIIRLMFLFMSCCLFYDTAKNPNGSASETCREHRNRRYLLLHSAVQRCTLLYSAAQCCTLLYSAVQCCTVSYSAAQCCALLYSAAQCKVLTD